MIKKPLVLTAGEIEQLQPGDSLQPSPNSLQLVNNDTIDLPICTPVYIIAADAMSHADATDFPSVIGMISEVVLIGNSGTAQTDGKITALTTEWDAITGQIGGLTAGATYYLGSVGGLVPIAPTTGFLARLGIAINSTDFEIKISRPIRL